MIRKNIRLRREYLYAKENEKKDTQIKQLQKATFIPIIRPSKFINPFRFYKIEPHVYLGEIERKIIISMDYISHFKSVSHVQISSPFNNFLTIGFSDGFNDVFTPQEYLFARLRSFGDSNLFEWANILQNYSEDYKVQYHRCKKQIEEDSSSIDCLVTDHQTIEDFLGDKHGIWINYKYTENIMWLDTVNISISLLEKLGYTLDIFIKSLFREGFPKIYQADHITYGDQAKSIFKKLYKLDFKKVSLIKKMDLINATGNLKSAIQHAGTIVMPRSNGVIEGKHYLYFDFDIKEEKSEQKSMELEENPEYNKQMRYCIKVSVSQDFQPSMSSINQTG